MCYYSTSCHKEFGDGSEHSQENDSVTVLKGDFQPRNNQRKIGAFQRNKYLSKFFRRHLIRSCGISKEIISALVQLVFCLSLCSSVKLFSIQLSGIFLALNESFHFNSSSSLNDSKILKKNPYGYIVHFLFLLH